MASLFREQATSIFHRYRCGLNRRFFSELIIFKGPTAGDGASYSFWY